MAAKKQKKSSKKLVSRKRAAPGVWRNNRKQFRKQRCHGEYKTFRDKRMFILTDDNGSGDRHRFNSHEAAKREGWFKV